MNFINEVCELFDICLLNDISADETNQVQRLVALGEPSEHAAGLRGYTVTPWFSSEAELNAFCERNIERFRTAAKASEENDEAVRGSAPDATSWS